MSKKKQTIEELLEDSLVSAEKQPYGVPENWLWVKSEFVAKWGSGGTPSRKKNEYYHGHIPWLKTGELKDKIIFDSEEKITEEGLKKSSAKLFPKNSVAIAMYGATIGKLGILGIDAATNQACAVGAPNSLTDKNFMFYYFLSQRKDLIEMGKGGAQPNISQSVIKEFPYPIPPVNEQKLITEKVECLINKVEEAKQLIEEAKETFELRRAAILDKAFRGDLTKKWRKEKNNKNCVPKLSIISVEAPYSLPKGWTWITLEDGCEKITDGTHHSPKSYPTGDYMYITAKNIKEKGVLLDNVSYVSKEVHEEIYSRCDVKKGDVLYIKDGATTGVATVNQLSEEFSLLSSVGLLRPKKELLLPEYLMFCLNSSPTKRRMLDMMSGNAIRRLTLKKIKQGIIPLPPIDEQHIIISILDKLKIIDEKLNWYS
ncbi:restriction endonuclease subunit S, partial [Bacillus thuringiensis]|uniref:restriction endonuclease subunit S n=1 Tax=Bacillus thuringiensis TaxID=1428 RepID=UPI003000423A